MSGICGIFGYPSVKMIKRMMAAMRHRGPDSVGFFHDHEVALSACRLSLLDLEGDDQPIINEGRNLCIVCDGEIYNRSDLRKQLKDKGHRFASSSDAEVVLHLFEEEGENCVKSLKGMFAFAIWNAKELLIARDRLGMKPLFYFLNEESFVFASEIKALFQCDMVARSMDPQVLSEQAVFGFPLGLDSTLFEGVRQLPPGTTMIVFKQPPTQKIGLRLKQYYILDIPTSTSNHIDELVDALQLALEESVQLHLEGNDPVGVMLSGGVDSSLLALISAKHACSPLKTFTVSDSSGQQDLKFSGAVAAQIGAEHHEFVVKLDDLVAALPRLVLALEGFIQGDVFARAGDEAFFLLSQNVSKFVKVALCGEGADELFGGYWMHRSFPGYRDQLREKMERLGLSETCSSELWDRFQALASSGEQAQAPLEEALRFFARSPLTNYHLWATDRCSMWHGLEVRLPYLYDDVVELAAMMPSRLKMRQGVSKYILKTIASRYLDGPLSDVVHRKKCGLPSAFTNISRRLGLLCDQLISDEEFSQHPFQRYFLSKVDMLMFDLLCFLFVENKGELPEGFAMSDLYSAPLRRA